MFFWPAPTHFHQNNQGTELHQTSFSLRRFERLDVYSPPLLKKNACPARLMMKITANTQVFCILDSDHQLIPFFNDCYIYEPCICSWSYSHWVWHHNTVI